MSETSAKSTAATEANSSGLVSDRGRTSIADVVVAKIAGIATREINGVHDLGGSAERVVGRVRDVLPGAQTSTAQGVSVEVGEREAVVDIAIVADYGVALHQLAAAIRSNVIEAIEQMTGLAVNEVNIAIHDINFGDDESAEEPAPRVQ